MAYQISSHQIPSLLKALTKWLPACLPVYQLIKHNYSNTWPAVTIYTDNDDVEKITTVLCSCGNYEVSLTDAAYTFYSVDNEALRLLLNAPGTIDWTSDLVDFHIVSMSQLPILKEVMAEHNRILPGYLNTPEYLSGCYVYTLNDRERATEIAERPLPEGFTFGKLKHEHGCLLHSRWHYPKNPPSVENYAKTIEYLPNLAIYNEKGEVVSWAVIKAFGDIGHTYTVPEYRKRGFASMITANLAKSRIEDGVMPYVVVRNKYEVSIKTHEKLGFEREEQGNVDYYCFVSEK
ncbi:glycine N-acyltransferase-like protein [Glandiceps talaboti]